MPLPVVRHLTASRLPGGQLVRKTTGYKARPLSSIHRDAVTEYLSGKKLGAGKLEDEPRLRVFAPERETSITFHGCGDIIYAYADSLSFTLNVMQVTAVVNAASSQAGPVAGGQFVAYTAPDSGPRPTHRRGKRDWAERRSSSMVSKHG